MPFNVTSATARRMRVSINIPIKVSTRMLEINSKRIFRLNFSRTNSCGHFGCGSSTFILLFRSHFIEEIRTSFNIDGFKKVSTQHQIQSSPNMMRSILMRQITIQQSNEIRHMIDNLKPPSIAENVCGVIPITSESSQIGCLNKVRKVRLQARTIQNAKLCERVHAV